MPGGGGGVAPRGVPLSRSLPRSRHSDRSRRTVPIPPGVVNARFAGRMRRAASIRPTGTENSPFLTILATISVGRRFYAFSQTELRKSGPFRGSLKYARVLLAYPP